MSKYMVIMFLLLLISVSINAGGNKEAYHHTVETVDMERFSGDWFVIALIPTRFEKGAKDGIENYSIDSRGNIRVEYTYIKNDKKKVMHQKGWIYDEETNAEWRVRPLWPFKLPYYIIELDDSYSYTVVATNNFNYLWIMAREPSMDDSILKEVVNRMVERGFNREKIVYMKQSGAK